MPFCEIVLHNLIAFLCRLPALMQRFDDMRSAGDLLPSAMVVDGEYIDILHSKIN
jgi:hypothetical protein